MLVRRTALLVRRTARRLGRTAVVLGLALAFTAGGVTAHEALTGDRMPTDRSGDYIYIQVIGGGPGAVTCFGGCQLVCCKIPEDPE